MLTFEQRFRAMNCEMGLWVVADDSSVAQARLIAVEAFIHATEAALSRFLPDSELSRLNARSGQPVRISPLLAEILTRALASARETDGLYDPTILAALEAAGYDRSFERLDARQPTFQRAARPSRGWQAIQFNPATRMVRLPRGVRLDLGGIVKGWVADQAAARLAAVGPCLVDAGGDIVAQGRPIEYEAWPVGVADPHHPASDLALLMLTDCGVATSGTDYRRWQQGDALRHHIIDPRTGQPADTDLCSVTVIAPTAARADLHAKVALILGSVAGQIYLEQQPGIEGVLISEAGAQWTTTGFENYLYR